MTDRHQTKDKTKDQTQRKPKTLAPKKELEENKKELEEKNKKTEEYLNQLKRIQADFDNYRKWSEKEREEHTKYANQTLLLKLIDVADNLDLALKSAKKAAEIKPIIDGIEKISKQLHSILGSEGLTPIKAVDELFDSNKHEAVSKIKSEKHPENAVVEEIQKGYMLGSKVIRHSKVVVSTKN